MRECLFGSSEIFPQKGTCDCIVSEDYRIRLVENMGEVSAGG